MKATGKPVVGQVEVSVLAAPTPASVRAWAVDLVGQDGVVAGEIVECSGTHPLVPSVEPGDAAEGPLVGLCEMTPPELVFIREEHGVSVKT